MDLMQLSKFILDNGFAVLLVLGILWVGYKIFVPYITAKLQNDIANDNQHLELLQQVISENRLTNKQMIDENKEVSKQLLESMEKVNTTNEQLSRTNEELSRTNRKLVEAYEHRFRTLEGTTDKIKDDVRDINTKVDMMVRK